MEMDNTWFQIANVAEVDTPFLAIFPERVKDNIRALKAIIPEAARLRPHVKTNKCKQVIAIMLEEGITKFKCATIAEAEMLALASAPDVLLAYQPIGPKIKRFTNLVTSYPGTKFACLVDNEEIAEQLGASVSERNLCVQVYLDLNVGMNRTGIGPDDALSMYGRISEIPGIVLVGLHAYDGHIKTADLRIRRIKYQEAYQKVEILMKEIIKSGFDCPNISAGSTPTLEFHADIPEVECSPGTFVYWDQTYDELYGELPFKAAVIVVCRVISKVNIETFCLDLGYKALSSESDKKQRIHFLNIGGVQILDQWEEHMLIKINTGTKLKIGDVLYGIPYHIGRTCNLYQSSSIVNNHRITGEWFHFTGRKIST
jgi:D-threonine aldolase